MARTASTPTELQSIADKKLRPLHLEVAREKTRQPNVTLRLYQDRSNNTTPSELMAKCHITLQICAEQVLSAANKLSFICFSQGIHSHLHCFSLHAITLASLRTPGRARLRWCKKYRPNVTLIAYRCCLHFQLPIPCELCAALSNSCIPH